jgi:hypothetical protein
MRVFHFLLELKSYTDINQKSIDACRESSLEVPSELKEAWIDGDYDNDIEVLVDELETELKMHNLLN